MPNNVNNFFSDGLDSAFLQVLDTNGNLGGIGSSLTAGTFDNGVQLKGAKALPATVPESETVPNTGDDIYLGGIVYSSAAPREFVFTAAISNFLPSQYMTGGVNKAYNIGNSTISFQDPQNFNTVSCAILANAKAVSQETTSQGQAMYDQLILFQVLGTPLGRESREERAAGIYRWKFVVNQSSQMPWGETFNSSVHGVTGATSGDMSSNYRKAWAVSTGNGVATAFTGLQFTPASTSLSEVLVYVNGYRQTTGVTVSTSGKSVTFSVAPANGAVIAVLYSYIP